MFTVYCLIIKKINTRYILRWNDWKLCHSQWSWLNETMLPCEFRFSSEKETSAFNKFVFHWTNKLEPKPINLKSFNFWNFILNANRFVSFHFVSQPSLGKSQAHTLKFGDILLLLSNVMQAQMMTCFVQWNKQNMKFQKEKKNQKQT